MREPFDFSAHEAEFDVPAAEVPAVEDAPTISVAEYERQYGSETWAGFFRELEASGKRVPLAMLPHNRVSVEHPGDAGCLDYRKHLCSKCAYLSRWRPWPGYEYWEWSDESAIWTVHPPTTWRDERPTVGYCTCRQFWRDPMEAACPLASIWYDRLALYHDPDFRDIGGLEQEGGGDDA